ncbi:AAA family ATPase [Sinomonas soli]
MFLLRFTFENHGSFRDEADLTLVKPELRSSRPKEGTWAEWTAPVAAVYGANASGKSCLLNALAYMRDFIANSATSWSSRKSIHRDAFALDERSKSAPSTFALDFVLDDIRFEYGFTLDSKAIVDEWLYTYPTGRKKVLFERSSGSEGLSFGRALGAGESTLEKVTGPRELVLAKGALLKHEQLGPIWLALTRDLSIARFGEADRQGRLRSVISDVVDGTFALDDLKTMLKVADVGIADARVEQQEADPTLTKILQAVIKADAEGKVFDEEIPDAAFEKLLVELARNLTFAHRGENGTTFGLPSAKQSTGTLTWLSLAAPALKAVRQGGVLAVDELDASLHPQLAEVLVQMFQDPEINTKHAQLIFTTHDTYFISPNSKAQLNENEVWFVEKAVDGASDLFRLSDFPTRKDQNFSRRYLQGRYGGVPSVAPSFLASLIEAEQEQAEQGETDAPTSGSLYV